MIPKVDSGNWNWSVFSSPLIRRSSKKSAPILPLISSFDCPMNSFYTNMFNHYMYLEFKDRTSANPFVGHVLSLNGIHITVNRSVFSFEAQRKGCGKGWRSFWRGYNHQVHFGKRKSNLQVQCKNHSRWDGYSNKSSQFRYWKRITSCYYYIKW